MQRCGDVEWIGWQVFHACLKKSVIPTCLYYTSLFGGPIYDQSSSDFAENCRFQSCSLWVILVSSLGHPKFSFLSRFKRRLHQWVFLWSLSFIQLDLNITTWIISEPGKKRMWYPSESWCLHLYCQYPGNSREPASLRPLKYLVGETNMLMVASPFALVICSLKKQTIL